MEYCIIILIFYAASVAFFRVGLGAASCIKKGGGCDLVTKLCCGGNSCYKGVCTKAVVSDCVKKCNTEEECCPVSKYYNRSCQSAYGNSTKECFYCTLRGGNCENEACCHAIAGRNVDCYPPEITGYIHKCLPDSHPRTKIVNHN